MAKHTTSRLVNDDAPLLALEGITRTYGVGATATPVLHGTTLTVKAGDAVAIVGPSGSGKSTLLHIAGLLDRPDAGVVRFQGQDVAKLNDDALAALRNTTCGFVYQFHHLLREFTAIENVMMPALMRAKPGVTKPRARAEKLLASVGLRARAEHYPSQLSGGEQQRVALARALMNAPQLLLADEPTGNLDPHTADQVTDMLFELIEKEKLAALIVTHNTALAQRCHRTLKMRE